MNVLEITIQKRIDDRWPVVAEYRPVGQALAGRRKEGRLQLSGDWRVDLRVLHDDARAYGQKLGEALFADRQIDRILTYALSDSGAILRLLLTIEDPELLPLHWERLCAPIGLNAAWEHVALDQRLLYARYLPTLAERHFAAIGRRDLRALVVIANPGAENQYNIARFDDGGTLAGVVESLGDIPFDVLGNLPGALGPATLPVLATQLNKQPYTLLHLVAHGWFSTGEGETIVYFVDADEAIRPTPATELLRQLNSLRGTRLPHLAFLCTCESAHPDADRAGAMGSLAGRLVRDLGLPAVVAMTQTVTIRTATTLARSFYSRLHEHGEADRALAEATLHLRDAGDITVPALFSRLSGRPLFSDTLDRELTHAEIGDGLTALLAELTTRAPLLLEEANTLAATVRSTLTADVAALSAQAGADRVAALAALNKICEEALDLNFRALALGQKPPPYDARCPFPGLAAFRDDFAPFFFGRDALVQRLLERWQRHRFLAVLGPSGSGKSSLVLAGLVPRLKGERADLKVKVLTPGNRPVDHLAAALREAPDILVVDQFEELFTLTETMDERAVFVTELLAASQVSRVAVTLRADFWGDCASLPELRAAMVAHQELVGPMTPTQLRRAMEQQAAAVGLRFEAGLGQTIFQEVAAEPGAMPLLQHLLQALWDRRRGRWLRASEYRALGGIRRAIAQTADDVYAGLSASEQPVVRHIFLRLTRLGDVEAAARDTRQRVDLHDLVPGWADVAQVRRLVGTLANRKLVISQRDDARSTTQVEVAHEALIRHWPRLRAWLDENRAQLQLEASLRQARQDWLAAEREVSYLVHRGSRLEAARELAARLDSPLSQADVDYIGVCTAQQEREKQQAEDERLSDLGEMGWGVIWAEDVPEAVKVALRPLLDLRRAQATTISENRYREFDYRPETAQTFLVRQGLGPGTTNPNNVPNYLLLVGSPENISFAFQYQLDVDYAVGRLYFDHHDPVAYANYAETAVRAATGGLNVPRRATMVQARYEGDRSTDMADRFLTQPLRQELAKELPDWEWLDIFGSSMTKARLLELLLEEGTGALLYLVSHTMTFRLGDERQILMQGAPLCTNWPGPSRRGPIGEEFFLTGAEVPDGAAISGTIVFMFEGAGFPLMDDFAHRAAALKKIAPYPFIAQFPQRLLGMKNGALALIGHVDRSWGYTFTWPGAGAQIGPLKRLFQRLLGGYTVGLATDTLGKRYALLASMYTSMYTSVALEGDQVDPQEMTKLRTAMVDARNWIILGDPAVRAPFPDP